MITLRRIFYKNNIGETSPNNCTPARAGGKDGGTMQSLTTSGR